MNRPAPVLRGLRVTLRRPAAGDAEAARRIGVYPGIARLFGEQPGADRRELTRVEAGKLMARLRPSEEKISWVVDAGQGFIGSASLHSFDLDAHTAAHAIGSITPAVLGRGFGTEHGSHAPGARARL